MASVVSFAKLLLPKKGIFAAEIAKSISRVLREMGNENNGDIFTVTATDECE